MPVLVADAVRRVVYEPLGTRAYDRYTPNCEALRSEWAAINAEK